MPSPPGLYLRSSRLLNQRTFSNALLRYAARLKWRTRESLICFAAAIRFLSFIGLSRRIVDQIDLALLTLCCLARVQFLRESTQLFRSARHLPHDTSYLSCASSWRCCWPALSSASPATKKRRCRLHGGASASGGPPGERNGQYRHGERTKAAIAEQRKFSALLKML